MNKKGLCHLIIFRLCSGDWAIMPTSSPSFAHDDSLLEMCAPFILKARSRPFDFDPQETRMLEVVSHQPTPPNSQMPMGWILALSWFRFVYHFTRALSADNFLFSVPFRLKAKRKKKRSHIFHFLDLIRIWLIPIQQFTSCFSKMYIDLHLFTLCQHMFQ